MHDRTEGELAGMFRLKKPAGNGAEAAVPVEVTPEITTPVAVAEPLPEPRPAPRRLTPPPLRSLTPAASLDLTRRPGELAGPTARADTQLPAVREKTLLVGRDVEFSGEIKACQKLIVEGIVHVSAASCRQLQVSPTGVYRGQIEVAEAEILGQFDGTLIARERLIVRATGRVSGKVRYGSIIIDAGGEVSGEIAAMARSADRSGEAAEASADEDPSSLSARMVPAAAG
jgi:cytoskeletal protein CcmA (bactofilin family)